MLPTVVPVCDELSDDIEEDSTYRIRKSLQEPQLEAYQVWPQKIQKAGGKNKAVEAAAVPKPVCNVLSEPSGQILAAPAAGQLFEDPDRHKVGDAKG